MSDDPKATARLEMVRLWYEEAQRTADEYRAMYLAALRKATYPPSVRFANLKMIVAIRQYLENEALGKGATASEIRDALLSGGAGANMPHFERDLKNSLVRSTKSGVLVKSGDKYLPGKKTPSDQVNRHGKKPLK